MIQHVAEVFEIEPRDWSQIIGACVNDLTTAERECNVLCALVAMALSLTISILLIQRLIKSANCVLKTIISDSATNINRISA